MTDWRDDIDKFMASVDVQEKDKEKQEEAMRESRANFIEGVLKPAAVDIYIHMSKYINKGLKVEQRMHDGKMVITFQKGNMFTNLKLWLEDHYLKVEYSTPSVKDGKVNSNIDISQISKDDIIALILDLFRQNYQI